MIQGFLGLSGRVDGKAFHLTITVGDSSLKCWEWLYDLLESFMSPLFPLAHLNFFFFGVYTLFSDQVWEGQIKNG